MDVICAIKNSDLRIAVEVLLREHPKFNLAGSVTSLDMLFSIIEFSCPEILILDDELLKKLPDHTNQKLHQFADQMEIILFTGEYETKTILGVKDFSRTVIKGDPPEKFINALEQVWLEHTQIDS